MIDVDKKLDRLKKEKPSIYPSDKYPEPFENEGGEFIEMHPQIKNAENDTKIDEEKNKDHP